MHGGAGAWSHSYVGRQRILNRDLTVCAYEILYRGEAGSVEGKEFEGTRATAEVLLTALVDIGLERIAGESQAFVNFTRELLVGEEIFAVASPGRLVVEVLESIEPDEETVGALRRLSKMGFTIALDDFVYHHRFIPFLKLADIVKIDIQALDEVALRRHVEICKRYGVRLLAEKVETKDEFDLCRKLGFHLFQGYFLDRPELVTGRRLPAEKLRTVQLAARVLDPEATLEVVEQCVRQDITLSYRVLRLSNSVAQGRMEPVVDIAEAVSWLGLDRIRRWVGLMAIADRPDGAAPLMDEAVLRARMCETLGRNLGLNPNLMFTIGMFSVLEAMFGTPIDEVLSDLPVAEVVANALTGKPGDEGRILRSVIAHCRAEWSAVDAIGIDPPIMNECWLEALDWAARMLRGTRAAEILPA